MAVVRKAPGVTEKVLTETVAVENAPSATGLNISLSVLKDGFGALPRFIAFEADAITRLGKFASCSSGVPSDLSHALELPRRERKADACGSPCWIVERCWLFTVTSALSNKLPQALSAKATISLTAGAVATPAVCAP